MLPQSSTLQISAPSIVGTWLHIIDIRIFVRITNNFELIFCSVPCATFRSRSNQTIRADCKSIEIQLANRARSTNVSVFMTWSTRNDDSLLHGTLMRSSEQLHRSPHWLEWRPPTSSPNCGTKSSVAFVNITSVDDFFRIWVLACPQELYAQLQRASRAEYQFSPASVSHRLDTTTKITILRTPNQFLSRHTIIWSSTMHSGLSDSSIFWISRAPPGTSGSSILTFLTYQFFERHFFMHRAHDHQWSCPHTRACNSDRQRHLYWHVLFHDHLRSFHLLLILHSSKLCFVIIHIIPHWIMCSWLESILHHLDNSILCCQPFDIFALSFSDLGFLCSPAQSTRLGNSLPRTETISLLVCVDNHVRLVLVKLLVVVVPFVVASWLGALCSVLLHVLYFHVFLRVLLACCWLCSSLFTGSRVPSLAVLFTGSRVPSLAVSLYSRPIWLVFHPTYNSPAYNLPPWSESKRCPRLQTASWTSHK